MSLKKLFKWNKYEFVKAVSGIFLFCLALNLFIMPNHLYNGGVLGTAQLVRTLLVNTFNIDVNFDIAGIINFIFNIPLFILAYKEVSKGFFARSLVIIILQTIFLTIIPVPEKFPQCNKNKLSHHCIRVWWRIHDKKRSLENTGIYNGG